METMTATFASYNLLDYQLAALQKAGITVPTPVQERAIPKIQEGRDVVAEAPTGSGKTIAYLLPQLQKIDENKRDLQVLILVPSRELAMQIAAEVRRFTEGSAIRSQALPGGANIERQIEKLKEKPHVVVGTPGRVLDIMKRKKLKVHEVKSITVDEIDQMIDLGFVEDVEEIIHRTLRDRQLLFFSATMSEEARRIALKWMRHPVEIKAGLGEHSGRIEHVWFGTGKHDKPDTLRRLVRAYGAKRAIVFVNEPDRVWWLVHEMRKLGLTAEGLHGEAAKIQREQAMNGFRSGKFELLIATDLAARGIDVEGVTHVFHFDPAADADAYVHRAGRTGRGTASGISVSIVAPEEKFILKKFEKKLGIRIWAKALEQGKIVKRRPPSQGKMAPKPKAKAQSRKGKN
jgi:ATP-dependent RNA helicase DeaD